MFLPNMKCLKNLVVAKKHARTHGWNNAMLGKQCWLVSLALDNIFLLTGLRIYTSEYKAQGPT